ncbi:hypothetical protein Tco_1073995 [Tanacetum coccineum]
MPTHKRIYIAPSHTKKIFGNMRRVGKGFSGRETPLFQTMMVQDQEEVGKGSERLSDSHHTPTIIQPSTSQPQKKQRSRRPKRKDTQVPQSSVPSDNVADEAINKEMDDSLVRAATTATSLNAEKDRGDTIAQTSSENVSKLSNDPLLARGNTLQSGKDKLKLKELMALFKKLEKKGGSKTHKLKRLYKVGRSARVISYDEASLGEINVAEKEVITVDPVITAGEVVTTASVDISTASPTKTTIADDLTIAQTLIEIRSKAIMEEPEKPTKRKDQIKHDKEVAQRLQTQMQSELEEEDRLLEEDKESEELKKCLEIIPDDGDDVTINATPLSTKSPTIVDYKIYKEGKKSYFQIFRADGNSQMYLTFGKMLKNFDREDLEVLWSIVKARFKKTEPVNYMDNFLLLNLKTMFEHHVEDNMFNDVKLQVDYEYEMAFELFRLVKKQLKEGYVPK